MREKGESLKSACEALKISRSRQYRRAAKKTTSAMNQVLLEKLKERFVKLPKFGHDDIEGAINSLAEELGIKKGKLIHPTRLAISGTSVGPGLYEMMEALGQAAVVKRLQRAIDHMNKKGVRHE